MLFCSINFNVHNCYNKYSHQYQHSPNWWRGFPQALWWLDICLGEHQPTPFCGGNKETKGTIPSNDQLIVYVKSYWKLHLQY